MFFDGFVYFCVLGAGYFVVVSFVEFGLDGACFFL